MKVFHFGTVRPHPNGKGTVGAYAVHVQCPWRIVASEEIVTGSADLYGPANQRSTSDFDPDTAMHERDGNLQNKKLGELLHGYDADTRSIVNSTESLVVTQVQTDPYGGVRIKLSPNYCLELIPCGSSDGEEWRFLKPGDSNAQFAVGAGRVLAI